MPLFIAVQFRALKIQNQNKCPSKNENSVTLFRNDILSLAIKWMELEDTIECEVSGTHKGKYYVSSHNQIY